MRNGGHRSIVVGLLMAATIFATSTAGADTAALVVSGQVGREAEGVVIEVSEAALRTAGWDVVRPAAGPGVLAALEACYQAADPVRCRAAAAGFPGSERIFAVRLSGATDLDGGGTVTITALLVSRTGERMLAEQRYCETCQRDRLAATTTATLEFLLRETSGALARGVLRVRSTPSGARVVLDGEVIGVTPFDYTVYPGRHEVGIDKPGHAIEVREVRVEPAATVDLKVTLRPSPAENADEQGGAGRRALAWTLGGAGLLAIAGGTWLIAADSPPEVDGERTPRHRDSTWPGVGVAAAGAAAAGTAIGLLARGSGSEPAETSRQAWGATLEGGTAWIFMTGAY